MRIKDQEFTIGKGHQVRAAKSLYPDVVRLIVPKDQAVALAQKILSAYQTAGPEDTHLGEIPLYGQLEQLDDE